MKVEPESFMTAGIHNGTVRLSLHEFLAECVRVLRMEQELAEAKAMLGALEAALPDAADSSGVNDQEAGGGVEALSK